VRPRDRAARPQPDVPAPDDAGAGHGEGRRTEALARPLRPPAEPELAACGVAGHTMTADEKLAAILAAIQTDPGNRGLARDPHDNLFTACPGDFAAACRSFVNDPQAALDVTTGFFIPKADPPAYETDGPLGAAFLLRSLVPLGYQVGVGSRHS